MIMIIVIIMIFDESDTQHMEHFTHQRIAWPMTCAKRPVGKNLKLQSQRRVLPEALCLMRFESVENKK